MSWQLGLPWLAGQLDRDLQAAARRAGSPQALWKADASTLGRCLRVDEAVVAQVVRRRSHVGPQDLAREVRDAGAWYLALGHQDYPQPLAQCDDPPFALFGCGWRSDDAALSARPVVAIVGARRPTATGRHFARDLARSLSRFGAVVVSGLALGIDASAHEGALDAGGPTIGVLGSGLDHVAPKTNQSLATRIRAAGGALVSEYWFGTEPAPWRFPARNRIVAALADAVVVVEAAERSGALITADFALDLGRPVLAVPGPPQAVMSAGCHGLLRAGAALCECAQDVISEVPHAGWEQHPGGGRSGAPDGVDGEIYVAVCRGTSRLDELIGAAGDAAGVIAALGRLELDGWISRGDDERYRALPR